MRQVRDDGSAVITGVEGAALKLGTAIAKYGATTWLQRRKAKKVRTATLAELAAAELTSPLQRNKLTALVDRIGIQVAEQLAPVLAARFGSLPGNEVDAAILAVVDVLADADLSDKAFLAADADAEELARRLRAQFDGPRRASLAADAVPLYELSLDLACRHLVQVVRHLPSFQQAALAEVLARLTTQTDHLETLLSRLPTTSLRAPSGTTHDDEFRTEYLRALVNKLDRLELLGLPTDEQPSLALTVAYLSLSASDEDGRRRRDRRSRSRGAKKALQTEGIQVEDAVSRSPRTLVRGDAGSGKTTLLDWLAVKASRGELTGALARWNHLVPFSVRLRSFSDGELPEVEQWVRHAVPLVADLKPDGWVRRQLEANRAWLLVDGVDEVPAHRRRAVRSWLRELTGAFPRLRVVVTSRPAAVDKRWLDDEGFSAIELEPMSQENIVAFIERWHDAAAGSSHDVPAALRRMRGQLEQPHLRELAATPLLCAMLCALNLTHRSELPRNRMDLYAKALSMLLHLRDRERGIAGLLDDAGKRVVLRDLAWRLTLANRVEFDRSQAREFVAAKLPAMPQSGADPEELLKHLLERSGVLRAPVPGKVDFVHRTFQEYLAADEAVQWHHEATVVGHAHLDTWRETVVMTCGHANARQATEMLAAVLDRAEEEPGNARALRLVATACLETAQDIAPDVRSRLDAMVRDKLVPPRSVRETESLASVGHQILRFLPSGLGALSSAQAVATTRVAALTGSADALPLLAEYAQDPREEIQEEIENSWHYFDPEQYADVVLSRAHLANREITVRSLHTLPLLSNMNNLRGVRIWLPATVQVSDLSFVSGIPALVDVDVWADEDSVLDLSPLAEHPGLRILDITYVAGITGAEVIGELTRLVHLSLIQEGPWRGGGFLHRLPLLRYLAISVGGDLDLTGLGNMPDLAELELADLDASKLVDIPVCAGVTSLVLAGAGHVHFADVLFRFPNVQSVRLDDFDVDFVGSFSTSLARLDLIGCRIGALDSLATHRGLIRVSISDSRNEPDLSPLEATNIAVYLSVSPAHHG